MMLATPVRNSEWSSTTSTRAWSVAVPVCVLLESTVAIPRSRNRECGWLPRQHDFGAGSRGGHECQRRADALGSLPHARHAEPGRAAIAGDATAIVRDRQPETDATHRPRAHGDATRACMPDGIGECLLR